MSFLENLENTMFPEEAGNGELIHQETIITKGYESAIEPVMNNGLALKMFQEMCCDGCTCKSESDHALE